MAFAMVGLKRSKTGLWTARKEIPADVRAAYGKREEKKSWPAELTAGQAKAELASWLIPIEERIALLRASADQTAVTLSQRQSRALAGEWYHAQVALYEENPGRPEDWWFTREELEPDDPEEREAGRVRPTAWLIDEREKLLLEKGLRLTAGAADALLQEMGDVWVSLCDLMERRAQGDYGPDPLAETLPSPEAAPTKAKAAVSLKQLFEDYAASGASSPRTVAKWRPHVNSFVAHIGHDDVTKVTPADVNGWVKALIAKPLAVKTVQDSYLPAIKIILADAVAQGLIPSNPAAGVKVRGPKTTQTRGKGLTDAEAETILKAALGPHPKSLPAFTALARRWVPWVCAYTGARVNEITQLRAMDIREEDGVWIIHITPEAGSVKTGKARKVPIHSHLIDQGFHKLGKAGDATPLFYDPKAMRGGSKTATQATKMGERLAKWVRSLGVEEGVQPNHGWRHRFKTVARAVRMDSEPSRWGDRSTVF
ncbi:tyrosine-type recombinase/integrase [Erythrobacter sp. T5W1-R]|uniref:tyrosine-type recombinase/integrase n=1 Tax=Erythrobacter sp. T5W1-R TaxID=3101752 RepID=UPI002AFF8818|nr:tyrosine-type recombinase/integrase [Erythrobacter sp. T5W1-R]MEA1619213.1 tyrosine-type recombinase/integrase [Erythrobacter sp. T5W1-R]